MDASIPHIPTPFLAAEHRSHRGFILAPGYTERHGGSSFAPHPTQGRLFTIEVPAVSLEDGRSAARRSAQVRIIAQGGRGSPVLRSESFLGNEYVGVFDIPVESAGTEPVSSLQEALTPSKGSQESNLVEPRNEPDKPSWVLVVATEQRQGGEEWLRGTDWSKAWVTPVRKNKVRYVTTTGDADDRESLPPAALAEPSLTQASKGFQHLARKYGAPAVALVSLDPAHQTVQVWLWRDGETLTAIQPVPGGGVPAAKAAALVSLETLFSARESTPLPSESANPEVRIESVEELAPQEIMVTMRIDYDDPLEHQEAVNRLSRIQSLVVKSATAEDGGLTIVAIHAGASLQKLESLITQSGILVSTEAFGH